MEALAFNWVEDQGGLPPAIHRLAKKLQKKGHTEQAAIAIAVAAAKRFAPEHAVWAEAVAQWEAKKAASHTHAFDPRQARDRNGEWTANGGVPKLTRAVRKSLGKVGKAIADGKPLENIDGGELGELNDWLDNGGDGGGEVLLQALNLEVSAELARRGVATHDSAKAAGGLQLVAPVDLGLCAKCRREGRKEGCGDCEQAHDRENGREIRREIPREISHFGRQHRPLRGYERLMALDEIERALDEARDQFEHAAGQPALAVAHSIAQAGKPGQARAALEEAITGQLEALYITGRRTVADELAAQGGAHTTYAFAGDRRPRWMRRRAKLAADGIIARILQAVGRLTVTARHSDADVQLAAEKEAGASLRSEAQVHAPAALNQGRRDEGDARKSEIRGVRYTSILDKNRCEQCALADDDVLRNLDDPIRLARIPPNPDCYGGDRCRCMEFFVLKRESAPSFTYDTLEAWRVATFGFDPNQPRGDHGRWVETLKIGTRVEIHDGVDAVTGDPVDGLVHGPVARTRGQMVMINAGTPRKPRWVYGAGGQVQHHARARPTDIRRQLAQPKGTLTGDQAAAVRDYTGGKGSVAEELNRSLRRRAKTTKHHEIRRHLDDAFARLPALESDGRVWRGTKAKGAASLKVGSVVQDLGFMSTSPSRGQAEDFVAYSGGDLFEIVLPAGARALDVNEAAGSRFAREREVLLPRGTRFMVESVTSHPDRDGRRVFRVRVIV